MKTLKELQKEQAALEKQIEQARQLEIRKEATDLMGVAFNYGILTPEAVITDITDRLNQNEKYIADMERAEERKRKRELRRVQKKLEQQQAAAQEELPPL